MQSLPMSQSLCPRRSFASRGLFVRAVNVEGEDLCHRASRALRYFLLSLGYLWRLLGQYLQPPLKRSPHTSIACASLGKLTYDDIVSLCDIFTYFFILSALSTL